MPQTNGSPGRCRESGRSKWRGILLELRDFKMHPVAALEVAAPVLDCGALDQDVFYYIAKYIGQAEVAACITISQLRVIHSQGVEHGGV